MAIIFANFPLVTQEIVNFIKKADEMGFKIIGIFTKPDFIIEKHTQKNAIGCYIIKNNLNLGYYILKFRGPNNNITAAQKRALKNSFFLQTPWSEIKRFHKIGMHELKIKVFNLFFYHINLFWYNIKNKITRQFYNFEFFRINLGNLKLRR